MRRYVPCPCHLSMQDMWSVWIQREGEVGEAGGRGKGEGGSQEEGKEVGQHISAGVWGGGYA